MSGVESLSSAVSRRTQKMAASPDGAPRNIADFIAFTSSPRLTLFTFRAWHLQDQSPAMEIPSSHVGCELWHYLHRVCKSDILAEMKTAHK